MTTPTLTQQDERLLQQLASGATSRDIAKRVGLTNGTTRVYLHKVYKKIGVKNKTQAAIWWLQRKPPKKKK